MTMRHPHEMLMRGNAEAVRGQKVQKGMVRRIARFARPYRWQLLGFMGAIFAGSVMTLIPPLLFRSIIDDIIPDSSRGRLHLFAILLVAAALAAALAAYLERLWSARIGEGLIFDLRVSLYDHVQRQPILFFTRAQTGALISRMNNDVIGAQRAFTSTLGQVAGNGILLILTLFTMLLLEWRLTLMAFLILPLFIIPTRRVGRRLQKIVRNQMEDNAAMNNTMTERMNVSGAMLVKLFGRYRRERDEFSKQAADVRDHGVRTALVSQTFFIALTLMGALGTALIYWYGGLMVINGRITIGTLAAMGFLVARIYAPLTALTNARVDLMTAFVSFDRVFEVLDAPIDIQDREGAAALEEPKGEVAFEDVRFTYQPPSGELASLVNLGGSAGSLHARHAAHHGENNGDGETGELSKEAWLEETDLTERDEGRQDGGRRDGLPQTNGELRPAVKGVSFAVSPGQHFAIVGPSGAGKTTLVSLVPRLYEVDSGAVKVDGKDVRDLTSESLRDAIGVVSQDPHFFHDTILRNLKYARPDATQAEIVEACRAAQIHSLIASLPEGYETVVGERGYRLSGGEKQRLAIARVILKNPAIIILDEATSHLDSENEAAIQAALANILRDRTALIVAHRLSTIISADQILVLDEGKLVEQGRHEELLAANQLYADLYRTLEAGETEKVQTG